MKKSCAGKIALVAVLAAIVSAGVLVWHTLREIDKLGISMVSDGRR